METQTFMGKRTGLTLWTYVSCQLHSEHFVHLQKPAKTVKDKLH